jgi:Restriction endonuclease AspBHI N-terminal/Restriction endonuclease
MGLAAPGFPGTPATEDLVAIWKTTGQERFQNYKATFTILDVSKVSHAWIQTAAHGIPLRTSGPDIWRLWSESGTYTSLIAPRSRTVRTKREQLPCSSLDKEILAVITEEFRNDPYGFEPCAAALARLLLPDISTLEITRRWRDGGRDAIGQLKIGCDQASISVTFALEAKCYAEKNSVGVREISRLISRLRHREFGIFVTTSYVDTQAYREIVDDAHPVIIICGADIVRLLRTSGYTTPSQVSAWLDGIERSITKLDGV